MFLEAGSKINYSELNNNEHSPNLMFAAKRRENIPSQVTIICTLKLFILKNISLSLSLSKMRRILFASRIQPYIVCIAHEDFLRRISGTPTRQAHNMCA